MSFVTQAGVGRSSAGAGWLLLLPAQRASAAQQDSVPCLHGCLCQRLSLCSWGREEGVSLLAFFPLSACSQGSPCHSQVPLLPTKEGAVGSPGVAEWGKPGG